MYYYILINYIEQICVSCVSNEGKGMIFIPKNVRYIKTKEEQERKSMKKKIRKLPTFLIMLYEI